MFPSSMPVFYGEAAPTHQHAPSHLVHSFPAVRSILWTRPDAASTEQAVVIGWHSYLPGLRLQSAAIAELCGVASTQDARTFAPLYAHAGPFVGVVSTYTLKCVPSGVTSACTSFEVPVEALEDAAAVSSAGQARDALLGGQAPVGIHLSCCMASTPQDYRAGSGFTSLHVDVTVSLPRAQLRFTPLPLQPMLCTEAPLAAALTVPGGVHTLRSALPGIPPFGLLTLDARRRVVPLLASDPCIASTPVVGVWMHAPPAAADAATATTDATDADAEALPSWAAAAIRHPCMLALAAWYAWQPHLQRVSPPSSSSSSSNSSSSSSTQGLVMLLGLLPPKKGEVGSEGPAVPPLPPRYASGFVFTECEVRGVGGLHLDRDRDRDSGDEGETVTVCDRLRIQVHRGSGSWRPTAASTAATASSSSSPCVGGRAVVAGDGSVLWTQHAAEVEAEVEHTQATDNGAGGAVVAAADTAVDTVTDESEEQQEVEEQEAVDLTTSSTSSDGSGHLKGSRAGAAVVVGRKPRDFAGSRLPVLAASPASPTRGSAATAPVAAAPAPSPTRIPAPASQPAAVSPRAALHPRTVAAAEAAAGLRSAYFPAAAAAAAAKDEDDEDEEAAAAADTEEGASVAQREETLDGEADNTAAAAAAAATAGGGPTPRGLASQIAGLRADLSRLTDLLKLRDTALPLPAASPTGLASRSSRAGSVSLTSTHIIPAASLAAAQDEKIARIGASLSSMIRELEASAASGTAAASSTTKHPTTAAVVSTAVSLSPSPVAVGQQAVLSRLTAARGAAFLSHALSTPAAAVAAAAPVPVTPPRVPIAAHHASASASASASAPASGPLSIPLSIPGAIQPWPVAVTALTNTPPAIITAAATRAAGGSPHARGSPLSATAAASATASATGPAAAAAAAVAATSDIAATAAALQQRWRPESQEAGSWSASSISSDSLQHHPLSQQLSQQPASLAHTQAGGGSSRWLSSLPAPINSDDGSWLPAQLRQELQHIAAQQAAAYHAGSPSRR